MNVNHEFAQMLANIMQHGTEINTRNSVTTRLRNQMITFEDTPLVSVRRTAWKNALREMEWFLSGSDNIKDLHEKVRHWWEPWANEKGTIDNNYSKQLRGFFGIYGATDQIEYAIKTLQKHPYSRRNVLTTWNTNEMTNPSTPITNCHGTVIQLFVEPDDAIMNKVHMTMYQRSCDMVLGVPHNWIQYWALLQYFAHRTGHQVGSFTWIGGDCHIYEEHYDVVKEIVSAANIKIITSPNLIYNPTSEDFFADDFTLDGEYDPFLKKSAKMVV